MQGSAGWHHCKTLLWVQTLTFCEAGQSILACTFQYLKDWAKLKCQRLIVCVCRCCAVSVGNSMEDLLGLSLLVVQWLLSWLVDWRGLDLAVVHARNLSIRLSSWASCHALTGFEALCYFLSCPLWSGFRLISGSQTESWGRGTLYASFCYYRICCCRISASCFNWVHFMFGADIYSFKPSFHKYPHRPWNDKNSISTLWCISKDCLKRGENVTKTKVAWLQELTNY